MSSACRSATGFALACARVTAKTLFGRAYIDDDLDPWLEMSVNMDGGVSRRDFEDTYDWWEVVLERLEEHIGFEIEASH